MQSVALNPRFEVRDSSSEVTNRRWNPSRDVVDGSKVLGLLPSQPGIDYYSTDEIGPLESVPHPRKEAASRAL